MGIGVFAEASPCCPSPLIGHWAVIAYIAGGTLVYLWLGSTLFRWAYKRYRQRATARTEP